MFDLSRERRVGFGPLRGDVEESPGPVIDTGPTTFRAGRVGPESFFTHLSAGSSFAVTPTVSGSTPPIPVQEGRPSQTCLGDHRRRDSIGFDDVGDTLRCLPFPWDCGPRRRTPSYRANENHNLKDKTENGQAKIKDFNFFTTRCSCSVVTTHTASWDYPVPRVPRDPLEACPPPLPGDSRVPTHPWSKTTVSKLSPTLSRTRDSLSVCVCLGERVPLSKERTSSANRVSGYGSQSRPQRVTV